jgi:hypothetical protein
MEAWPSSSWICSSSPPPARHSLAQVRRRSFQRQAEFAAVSGHEGRDRLGRHRLAGDPPMAVHGPQDPATGRSGCFAPEVDGPLDPGGDGPGADAAVLAARRPTIDQRPSCCWMSPTVSATAAPRRRPQPTSGARMARSRLPPSSPARGRNENGRQPGSFGPGTAAPVSGRVSIRPFPADASPA